MFRRAVWDKLNKKAPLNQVERGYVLDGLFEQCAVARFTCKAPLGLEREGFRALETDEPDDEPHERDTAKYEIRKVDAKDMAEVKVESTNAKSGGRVLLAQRPGRSISNAPS